MSSSLPSPCVISKYLFYAVLFIGLTIYGITLWWPYHQRTARGELVINMLNIGQGDAIYLRTPQGRDILIDGGPDRSLLNELGEVMPFYDHQLEVVIATHDDLDHIGGLVELKGIYDVQMMINNGLHKTTALAQALAEWETGGRGSDAQGRQSFSPRHKKMEVLSVQRGERLQVESELFLEFVNPTAEQMSADVAGEEVEANDASVVALLRYKNFSALFTGDAGIVFEQEWLEELAAHEGEPPDVDLLKVSHHGSRTGTSKELVEAVKPEVALISVGVNNKFGHPHTGPLWRLEASRAQVWRTDVHRRVECVTTGQEVSCQSVSKFIK